MLTLWSDPTFFFWEETALTDAIWFVNVLASAFFYTRVLPRTRFMGCWSSFWQLVFCWWLLRFRVGGSVCTNLVLRLAGRMVVLTSYYKIPRLQHQVAPSGSLHCGSCNVYNCFEVSLWVLQMRKSLLAITKNHCGIETHKTSSTTAKAQKNHSALFLPVLVCFFLSRSPTMNKCPVWNSSRDLFSRIRAIWNVFKTELTPNSFFCKVEKICQRWNAKIENHSNTHKERHRAAKNFPLLIQQ